ncbi:MAG TPA: lipoyl synthase [Candidatus Limnocylindrales bacterium]|nr:lipoyl synthase [Candidatus Limnocylindrales bacterium]
MSASAHRLPPWVVSATPHLAASDSLKRQLRQGRLVTVCEEARCPNIGECFSSGTATFMLLGDTCTRRCQFCSVATGRPLPPDPDEPSRVAETAAALGLRYIVVTTVARDDLADEGAGQFAATITALHERIAGSQVEVLTADFNGRRELIEQVLAARPEVFGHNMETVRRLTPEVRGRAKYERSLEVLRIAAQAPRSDGCGVVKTGIMVGFGETRAEISETLRDIRATGCELLTIGQYLRPTREHRPVSRYLPPEEFDELACEARELGFSEVASGPLVRSSYRADRLYAASAGPQR